MSENNNVLPSSCCDENFTDKLAVNDGGADKDFSVTNGLGMESEMQSGLVDGKSDLGNNESSVRKIEVSDPKMSLFVDFTGVLTHNNSNKAMHSDLLMIKACDSGEGKTKDLETDNNQTSFVVGDIVWIKTKNKTWWPGKVCHPSDFPEHATLRHKKSCLLVQYFGRNHVAWCFPAQLIPFLENFEPMSRENKSRMFPGAVELAIDEFCNRLQSEMATSNCNSGEKLGEFSKSYFEPALFLKLLNGLALSHVNPGVLQFATALSRLSMFNNFMGHSQVPLHLLRNEEEESSKARNVGVEILEQNLGLDKNPDTVFENEAKADTGFDLRVRRRSKYLSYPYENNVTDKSPSVVAKSSSKKKWSVSNRSENTEVIRNVATSNLLSELYYTATDCCYPDNKKEFGSIEWFFSRFRISAFQSMSEINYENMVGEKEDEGEVKEASVDKSKIKKRKRKSTTKLSNGEFPPTNDAVVEKDEISPSLNAEFGQSLQKKRRTNSKKIKSLSGELALAGPTSSNGNLEDQIELTNGVSLSVEFGQSVQKKKKGRTKNSKPDLKTDVGDTPQTDNATSDCKLRANPVSLLTEKMTATAVSEQDIRENGSLSVDLRVTGPYSVNFVSDQPNSNADIPTSVQAPGEGKAVKRKYTKKPKSTTGIPVFTINFVPDPNSNADIPSAQPVKRKWTRRKPKATTAGVPDLTGSFSINFASEPNFNTNSDIPSVQPEGVAVRKKWARKPKPTADSTGQFSINFMSDPNSNSDIPSVQPSGEVVRKKWARKPKATTESIPDLNGSVKPEPKKRKRIVRASAGNGELLLTFSPGAALPLKEDLVTTFSTFGLLKESEIKLLEDSNTAHVVFVCHANAEEAFRSLAEKSPFGSILVNYQLRHLDTPTPMEVFKTPAKCKPFAPPPATQIPTGLKYSAPVTQIPTKHPLTQTPTTPNVYAPSPQAGETPPIDFIKQNLAMMTSLLEKSGDNLSPGMRLQLENEIAGLMKKVSSMPGSLS